MGVTDSTAGIYGAIRTRLLTFNDSGAEPNTITEAASGRVYSIAPPDPASNTLQAVPFVLFRIRKTTVPGGDPTRFTFDVDAQVVHRPWSNVVAASRIADLVEGALVGRILAAASADGFLTMTSAPQRIDLPAGGGDADRTVVMILITASGYGYSKALAAALT